MFRLLCLLLTLSLIADEKVTTHSLKLGEESLDYTATVVSGEVSYIAYVKQTTENRPITFAFNGGPGSSSVWLHIGTLGPRRLLTPEEGQPIIPPYQLVDNVETLLDVSDLVFIDPAGTGLSKEEEKNYTVKTDIETIAKCIRDYLTQNRRWNSPKYLAGESYGGLRVAGLAEFLQEEWGVYLNGLLFISPAIDYQTFVFQDDNILPYFLFLPTYTATAWYHGKYRPEASLEEVVQEAREFGYKSYAAALLAGNTEPLYDKLSSLTGLPLFKIEEAEGDISSHLFANDFFSKEKLLLGHYDTRLKGSVAHHFSSDPSVAPILGNFTAAFHDYLHKELEFPNNYSIFSMGVNQKWDHHNYNPWGYPSLMQGLRKALINNPALKIYVGCGYFDLATPFASAEYCFNHLKVPHQPIQMDYYKGGHMYYLVPSERVKFKQDLKRFYD
jgi:carboxypeptidase C (cathepsin A)